VGPSALSRVHGNAADHPCLCSPHVRCVSRGLTLATLDGERDDQPQRSADAARRAQRGLVCPRPSSHSAQPRRSTRQIRTTPLGVGRWGRQRYRVVGGTPFCHPIAALIRWTGCVTDPLGPCGVLHRASSDARHGFVLVAAFSAFSVSSAVAAYDIAAWRRRRTTGRNRECWVSLGRTTV